MRFLILIMLLMSFSLHAQVYDPHFEMRVSWIKSLKSLLSEIEMKEKNLVVKEKHFLERFKLMNEAWADSRYNCFYGGWPSTLIQSGKKKLCQNPSGTNSSYNASSCKGNELQCQPLLFGIGLCVSFATQAERNKTFANCEDKFQKNHNGNYDFLKSPSRKEVEDLRELSELAGTICAEKPSEICGKIMSKLPAGLKSLDAAHTNAVTNVIMPPKETATAKIENGPADCVDPSHQHESLAVEISSAISKTVDDRYEEIKKEFLSSPLCDPTKIINDPKEKPSGFLMGRLVSDMRGFEYLGNLKGPKDDFLQKIVDRYKLSDEVKANVLPLLNALTPYPGNDDERRNLVSKSRGLILQDYLKNYKPENTPIDIVKEELAANNIFKENDEGQIECPFLSEDAFLKALAGREAVLKKHGASLKNKDQLTIVDYSRPSNERRMFVIDLKTNKVLHNTWVAHGGGGYNGPGKDGLGSSPDMSNVSGSKKSSDGFVIATAKASGKLYGPNVLLKGIDVANNNLAARAVVLHGWGSPMHSYSAGVEDYDVEKETYGAPYDAIEKVKNADFSNASTKEMEKALWSLRSSVSTSKHLGATEGCLGVPMINVKHLDRKGRNKTQLELLREDLPGSLIFNYSGPQMKSKFF
jgi:hypothetical protein